MTEVEDIEPSDSDSLVLYRILDGTSGSSEEE